MPGFASVLKDRLSSLELSIAIGMAISKNQLVFQSWSRSVAASMECEVDAEMAKTVQGG